MILRQVIGFGALTLSAVVPVWTARAVLGVIVGLLQHNRRDETHP